MIDRTETLMTVEELAELPGHKYSELVRGRLQVHEPPGQEHGRLAARLGARLDTHVEQHQLGEVFVESGYVLQRGPDTLRGPDISFVSRDRASQSEPARPYFEGAPDLAVEILSPSTRRSAIEEKLAEYFAAGARMVWVVDTARRRVIVQYPHRTARIVTEGETLDGESVVPGFACSVRELFG